jgi:arylsulfatase A
MVLGWRLHWTTAFGSLLLVGGGLATTRENSAFAVPNVVMFVADDMGWTDWQYNAVSNPTGSLVYETPNLLALANQSVVFSNAYASAPVCSPTRMSILTGKSPARNGMTGILPGAPNTSATLKEPNSWIRQVLPAEITLAESLKSAGYATGFFGKWHLGSFVGTPGIDPLQNGFDVNVGGNGISGPDGAGGYFAGSDGMWNGLPGLSTPNEFPSTTYLSDAVDGKIGAFIQDHASSPFFLADFSFLGHIPLQAPSSLVNKYVNKINTLQGQGVNLKGQTNATYAAMMEKLDQSVGFLLNRLDDPNHDGNTSDSIRDNTIIIFTSDNGGAFDADGKPTVNLPAREGKGSMYEGGLRVPQLISWTGNPNAVAAGTVTSARTSSYDLYPTVLDLAGFLGNGSVQQNTTIDGVSLRDAIKPGGDSSERGLLYWHYPHRSNQDLTSPLVNGGAFVSAVSDETWKLLFFYEDRHYELYNLVTDIGETTNLLAHNPAIAHDLSLALQSYLVGVGARMPVAIATNQSVAAPPVLAAPMTGDYNGDSVLNAADYVVWRSNFGSTTLLAADGNRNGIVDTADYSIWRKLVGNIGSSPTTGDYNGDSVVNVADYAVWRSSLGSTTLLAADGNRNGIVDTADYAIWRKLFVPATTGDYNGDSVVNAADYAVWRSSFGSTSLLAADGNQNGIIDTADYVIWRKLLGSGSGSGLGELAGVPEPGSMLLLAIGMISAALPVRYRRRATR